jgi:predicted DCC family thiol-disulfide oxidoreductase YuxK
VSPELKEACKEALHVVKTDGGVLRGAPAVLFVYEGLGYRGLAIGRRRPFSWALDAGYAVVANNRTFFSKVLFLGD